MHKKFYRGTALLLSLSCLTGITAKARYESPEQIVVNLKAVSGGMIEDNGHKVYISPEEAQNGTSVHFGIWFETDVSLTDINTFAFEIVCDTIEFGTYQNPTLYAYPEAQEFTHTDGNVYSTRFKPYCFGRINDFGRYEHGASFCQPTVTTNMFSLEWDYDYYYPYNDGFSTEFFGDASDSYSFIEFDVNIPAGTPAGTYPITFVKLDVGSDHSIPDEENPGKYKSRYSHITPMSYEAEIIVEGNPESPKLEADIQPVFRYAEDTREFSVQDFPAEAVLTYKGETFDVQTEDLLEVFETGSPADLSMNDEPFRILRSELTWEGQPILDSQGNPAALEYRIGRKGDVNLDGVVNAQDAALILKYAAANGAGLEALLTEGTDTTEEDFARFLGDIDGIGEEPSDLDARDAARILKYAALKGAGQEPDWSELF